MLKKLAVKFEGNEIMSVDDYDLRQKRKMLFGKVSSLAVVAQQTALD